MASLVANQGRIFESTPETHQELYDLRAAAGSSSGQPSSISASRHALRAPGGPVPQTSTQVHKHTSTECVCDVFGWELLATGIFQHYGRCCKNTHSVWSKVGIGSQLTLLTPSSVAMRSVSARVAARDATRFAAHLQVLGDPPQEHGC